MLLRNCTTRNLPDLTNGPIQHLIRLLGFLEAFTEDQSEQLHSSLIAMATHYGA
jgi:hypothetical protein